jgi:hypothetical protein
MESRDGLFLVISDPSFSPSQKECSFGDFMIFATLRMEKTEISLKEAHGSCFSILFQF